VDFGEVWFFFSYHGLPVKETEKMEEREQRRQWSFPIARVWSWNVLRGAVLTRIGGIKRKT
jgi:hypothetical protein